MCQADLVATLRRLGAVHSETSSAIAQQFREVALGVESLSRRDFKRVFLALLEHPARAHRGRPVLSPDEYFRHCRRLRHLLDGEPLRVCAQMERLEEMLEGTGDRWWKAAAAGGALGVGGLLLRPSSPRFVPHPLVLTALGGLLPFLLPRLHWTEDARRSHTETLAVRVEQAARAREEPSEEAPLSPTD